MRRTLSKALVAVSRVVVLLSLSALLVFLLAPKEAALINLTYEPPPVGMVFVAPGNFLAGSDDPLADADERPLRREFARGFYIDRYEVTNADYERFDSDHTFPKGQEDHPVTGILLEHARNYAEWIGKRLPTKLEWEKAARGTDGRLYTWGNEFEAGRANLGGQEALVDVGSYPESISPYGAHDMIGNAWEWVEGDYVKRGLFGKRLYTTEIIKGGAFSYNSYQGRASYNGFEGNGGTCNDVGFRCALTAKGIRPSQ